MREYPGIAGAQAFCHSACAEIGIKALEACKQPCGPHLVRVAYQTRTELPTASGAFIQLPCSSARALQIANPPTPANKGTSLSYSCFLDHPGSITSTFQGRPCQLPVFPAGALGSCKEIWPEAK